MPHADQAITTEIPSEPRGIPPQTGNQQDALGQRSSKKVAREVAEFHRKGLDHNRERNLTAEKYMLHIDGEGDSQYAELYRGSRITITPDLSGTPRAQENLLRPIVDNAVAYHTTMPLRVVALSKPDRESREQALVNQALANHIIQAQNLNAVFAEAMYMAMPYGSCPVHAFWRDDLSSDPYEPVWNDQGQLLEQISQKLGVPPEQVKRLLPQRGFIDAWVGDPWDTVYSTGSTRTSIQAATYGRTLPADLVRAAFSHVPGIDRLEGSDTLPSASRFQRIARKWNQTGLNIHGSPTVYGGEHKEELIALVYREIEAGVDPEWPDGRMTIVALNGTASTDRAEASGGHGYGEPVILHDGPLPGGRKSFEIVYSSNRFDDVYGKPFVGDLDDLQVRLNQLETLLNEYFQRSTRPPLLDTGLVDNDVAFYADDAVLELDPEMMAHPGAMPPQFMELPYEHVNALEQRIEAVKKSMWTIGGYQAASRGESKSGDPYAKVVALARADDTIHGPVNQRFRETVSSYLQLCWSLFKENADVGWVVDMAGEDYAHLAEPYIDRTMVSDEPPEYKVVSGWGATPEAKAQQLMQLVQMQGADGDVVMSTDEMRKQWPDPSTFEPEDSGRLMRQRRPKVVNARIRELADKYAEQNPQLEQLPMGHPQIQRLAQQLAGQIHQQFPMLIDDDHMTHIDTLSQITQDESEVPLARMIAQFRQQQYFAYVQQRAQAQQEAAEEGGEGEDSRGAEPPAAGSAAGGATGAAQMAGAQGGGSNETARMMAQ